MGISSRKDREKKELRAKIIDATAKILIDQGYEKTTIRKVAEAIEYSPRTVYLYFKDKDSLLMEIIEVGFAGTLEKRSRLKETLDYSKPEQIFGIQVMANIQTALSSPNLYKAILYLLQYKAYPPGPRQMEVIQDVKYDIEICHKYKGSKVQNSGQKAELIFAFLRGFNLMLINKIGDLTEEEIESYKQSCVQMVLKGIVGL
jgi:AcrR family transcriptional regulator